MSLPTPLRRNAPSLPALFFYSATAAAPMTALLFNVPVIVSGAGWAVPAAFLVAAAMTAFSAYLVVDNRGSLPWIVAAVRALGALVLQPWNARVPQTVPAYES